MKKIISLSMLLCLLLSALVSCGEAAVETETDTVSVTDTETEKETKTETEPETEEDVKDKKMQRYFIYRIWNFRPRQFDNVKKTVDSALAAGFTAIKIHMPWHRVEDENGNINYDEFDKIFDYVINEKGVKAAVSIDFARRYGDKMLSDDELMRDMSGKLCVGDVQYERAALSFSSETATAKAVSFYEKAVKHFNDKYGDNILLYLPAFTQYCETEYWCAGQYDYSVCAINAFRNSLKEKFGTVDKLNEATKKSFDSFETVEAPACSSTDALGVLWYNFRHDQLKAFIDRLAEAQKRAAPDSKLALQLGSVFDEASNLRCTLRFADLCEHADVLWIDDAPLYDHDFSMDYVRSSLPDGVIIAQEIDGPLQAFASPEAYLAQGLKSFQRGAVIMSAANWEIDDNFNRYKDVWKQISETWLSDETPEVIEITADSPTLKISVYDMFKRKSPSGFITKYNKALKNAPAVKIIVTDDMEEHEAK